MATLGDLADAIESDNKAITADKTSIGEIEASLASSQLKLADDQTKLETDDKALGAAIAATGGFFRVNEDGTATVYEPDGSGGVVIKVLKPDSTPVP